MQQNKRSVLLLGKTSWLMILALSASSAMAAPIHGGERFAPVSVVIGQGVRVVVANVRIPDAGAPTDPCPVVVRFLGADGTLIGAEQAVSLAPGASISVAAAPLSVAGGAATLLVRAIVSVAGSSDPGNLCALKSGLEMFDIRTGSTMVTVSGKLCVGAAACSTPLGQ
jgi:hypothetical protein